MSWRRDRIDNPPSQINLRYTVGPVRELIKMPHAVQIESHNLNIWQAGKLPISQTMVIVPVRMHDEQRQLRSTILGQQIQHSLCQRHLFRIRNIPGIDEQCFRRSHQQIHERRFECCAKILS